LVKQINNFKKYSFLLVNLIKRDISVKYRRSILGILWSVLNPLFMMVIITTVFSKLFARGVENFHIYYLTGITIYNFINDATTSSLTSIVSNAGLLKKVYIPKYIFPIEKVIFSLVNVMFSMIAVFIVMAFTGIKISLVTFLFPIPLFYTFVFSIGISLALSALTVFFRDILHIYGLIMMAWMYATPLIYPIELVNSSPTLSIIIKYNPMYYLVTYFRDLLMYNKMPTMELNIICVTISLISLIIGIIIFNKAQDKFVLHI